MHYPFKDLWYYEKNTKRPKGLFFLETGLISANFNLSGKLPVLKISLKRFCRTDAVELAHFLKIFVGISFWVPDFFELKERISLSTL